ncbi:hypothetical protein QM012_006042 [Aureobasidium pullulans]|uniref:Uncharacterized protein n=1 Tax=Aureobasidium pullulans TaxID=5580 RepID=A0ABR0TRF2_AURPU
MCWGTKEYICCWTCRETTPRAITWHGCHLQVGETDSPICPEPVVTKFPTTYRCQTCQTEAADGGDPDDIYPEPFDHPGFSDTKPVIEIERVQLQESTAYESFWKLENLAGTADELPNYEDAMKEVPKPPSYNLTMLRDDELPSLSAFNAAMTNSYRRHNELTRVAKKYRQQIDRCLSQGPGIDLIRLLDFANETIETFLYDQEQRISRAGDVLGCQLLEINEEIDLLPSPPEMALLERKRQSIIRELEEYADQHNLLESAEVWDGRLGSLLEHISEKIADAKA